MKEERGKMATLKDTIKKAETLLGGRSKLAELVGVSYKTASDWANGRSGMSALNASKIETLTDGKITKKEILPDFPWGD